MRIIEMERRTINGEPVVYDELNECAGEYRDWWCVIETKEEEIVYDKAHTEGENAFYGTLWDAMVNYAGQGMGVKWGDDDMYGYIRPDEVAPAVSEDFIDGDGDTWVRVE